MAEEETEKFVKLLTECEDEGFRFGNDLLNSDFIPKYSDPAIAIGCIMIALNYIVCKDDDDKKEVDEKLKEACLKMKMYIDMLIYRLLGKDA